MNTSSDLFSHDQIGSSTAGAFFIPSMGQVPTGWRGWAFDIHLALTFLLRLKILPLPQAPSGALARAMRVFPLVGAGIGACGAVVYTSAVAAGLIHSLAALLSLAAMTWFTGGLHEDGLADMADGFSAIGSRTHKLAVMRDSCIGASGALVLLFGIAIRTTAIASVGSISTTETSVALILAETMARTAMPLASRLTQPARLSGLGITVEGAGCSIAIIIAITITIIFALALSQPRIIIEITLSMIVSVWAVTAAARRHIGGYTGDVLGGTGYIAGTTVLLSLAIR